MAEIIRGAKAIAAELGVSERTVRRWIASGILTARKDAENTSPWVVDERDLARLRPSAVQRYDLRAFNR